MRLARAFVVTMTTVLGSAASFACNAILGNEERVLDERGEVGLPPDDANVFDAGPDGNPCGADLAADPKNCGACGHDCLGGACNAGRCQPFTLATGQKQPLILAVRGGVAYWAGQTGTIHSCAVAGCNGQPKLIMSIDAGNPLPSGLDVRDDTVYVLGYYSQAIDTCPTTGCAAPVRIAQNLDYPEGLAVDDDSVYFASANGGFVGRCARPSCAGGPVHVATRTALEVWSGLVADDATLYWFGGPNKTFDKTFIYRAPKTLVDGGPEIIASDVAFPSALGVSKGFLFVSRGGTTISSYALDGGFARADLATMETQAYGMAVDATHVYWLSATNGTLRRCPREGCQSAVETLVDRQNEPQSLNLTDNAIYWTELGAGTIKGLAK